MKKLIFYLVFILFGITTYAQDTSWQQSFEKANAIYEKEHFNDAIKSYLKLSEQIDNSPELYFNLANAYFKIEKYTDAVYFYEKALMLDPTMSAAKTNLNFAKEHTKDDITIIEEYDKSDILHTTLNTLSVDQWAILATLASFIILVLFITYYQARTSTSKRILLTAIGVVFLIGVGSVYFASFESKYSQKTEVAIIFKPTIELKDESNSTSKTIKELHEGTKVFILEHKALWLKVRLENQEIGWIQKSTVKEI